MEDSNYRRSIYIDVIKKLSVRECVILDKVAEGKTNKEIASDLYISKRTVENHRLNICRKIGICGRGALNRWIQEYYNT